MISNYINTLQKNIWIFLLSFMSLSSVDALAECPSFVFGEEISKHIQGNRNDLKLFVNHPKNSKDNWYESVIQIDPMFYKKKLRFYNNDQWRERRLNNSDRVSLRVNDFSERANGKSLPCMANNALELTSSSGKFAYLVFCRNKKGKKFPVKSLLNYNESASMLESFSYQYFFDSENKMLFSLLRLKNKNQFVEIARESNLKIFADIKRFFSLTFDKSEIKSTINRYNMRTLGGVARLSFFLKVLFFKIDLKLNTDLSFFDTSAHVPMTMHLPMSGKDKLNTRSGMIYSWSSKKSNLIQINMPIFNGQASEKLYRESELKKYCLYKGICRFELILKNPIQDMKMYLNIPKPLVYEGFYPQFIHSIDQLDPKSGFAYPSIKHSKTNNHSGIFFRTAGLNEGSHDWDLWLDFNFSQKKQIDSCPQKVRLGKWNNNK